MSEYGRYPYGLRNVVVADESGGNFATLPAAQLFSFVERIRSEKFSGDDRTLAIAAFADGVDWSLEHGGIGLDVYALMTGRTIAETGSTPSRVATLTGEATEQFPYVKIYGKAVGDGADDIHIKIWKAKVMGAIEGGLQDGEFLVTKCSGVGIDDGTNGVWDLVQNETAANLATS